MKIVDVKYDTEYYSGCPTCDYGSSYIMEFSIIYDDDSQDDYKLETDNGKLISEGNLMVILANANTKEDIRENIIKLCVDKLDADFTRYYSGKLYINNNEVKIDFRK